jgi:hypothetical protein
MSPLNPQYKTNGTKDYIGRRGGDLMVEVNPEDASIYRVLWGQ